MTDNIISRLILTASATNDHALADLLREAARHIITLSTQLHDEKSHALILAAALDSTHEAE